MTPDRIRRLVLAAGRVPRYVTVGEPNPQTRVRVMLEGTGAPIDVTRNHVVSSLKPLTFAVAGPDPGRAASRSLALRFCPAQHPDATLGRVLLVHEGATIMNGAGFQLYRATGSVNACLRGMPAAVFRLYHAWAERRRRPRPTFWITSRDLRALQVVYMCPRPVVFVSVEHGAANNLFPMDLVGPTATDYFLLALRNTSPSIPLMTGSGRVALADVPVELAALARRLGEHHKKTGIDWDALPVETDTSPAHGLRVPREALRVRDLEIRDTRVVGSHTLFVTRVVRDVQRRAGLQMAGISGSYYRHLRLTGAPLPPLA